MAEKNIILHWSRVYHEIFQNSIFLAYVPKKNIFSEPVHIPVPESVPELETPLMQITILYVRFLQNPIY